MHTFVLFFPSQIFYSHPLAFQNVILGKNFERKIHESE